MEKIGGRRRDGLKMRALGGREHAHVVFAMRKSSPAHSGIRVPGLPAVF
jgi:hypothetical protein